MWTKLAMPLGTATRRNMGEKWMEELVEKAILLDYKAPDDVTHPEIVAATIRMGIEHERARCRAIANHYEKGPEAQARLAGTIRQQIESGLEIM